MEEVERWSLIFDLRHLIFELRTMKFDLPLDSWKKFLALKFPGLLILPRLCVSTFQVIVKHNLFPCLQIIFSDPHLIFALFQTQRGPGCAAVRRERDVRLERRGVCQGLAIWNLNFAPFSCSEKLPLTFDQLFQILWKMAGNNKFQISDPAAPGLLRDDEIDQRGGGWRVHQPNAQGRPTGIKDQTLVYEIKIWRHSKIQNRYRILRRLVFMQNLLTHCQRIGSSSLPYTSNRFRILLSCRTCKAQGFASYRIPTNRYRIRRHRIQKINTVPSSLQNLQRALVESPKYDHFDWRAYNVVTPVKAQGEMIIPFRNETMFRPVDNNRTRQGRKYGVVLPNTNSSPCEISDMRISLFRTEQWARWRFESETKSSPRTILAH